ncbi:hypothetical protein QNI19_35555 [Cytophagaceae bacterium DM2B3-1]|uniref:Uncharacterized protein n=1 Tax=Xanthocytophaga flava TaxID=3048013 RepID=A0ABT7CXT2_9BACT|nr:hypothetical protein [Xanthocytophaga flavus]MDJ1498306.1 hypothetical protein [Xanthocytophaga flavus]
MKLFFTLVLFVAYLDISYAQSANAPSMEEYIQKYVHENLTVSFMEENFGKGNYVDLQTVFVKIKTNLEGRPTAVILPYPLSMLAQTALKKKFDQLIVSAEKQMCSRYLEASIDYTFAIHIYKPAMKRAPGKSMDPYIGDLGYFYEDGSRFMGPIMFTLVVDLEDKKSTIDDGRHIEIYH